MSYTIFNLWKPLITNIRLQPYFIAIYLIINVRESHCEDLKFLLKLSFHVGIISRPILIFTGIFIWDIIWLVFECRTIILWSGRCRKYFIWFLLGFLLVSPLFLLFSFTLLLGLLLDCRWTSCLDWCRLWLLSWLRLLEGRDMVRKRQFVLKIRLFSHCCCQRRAGRPSWRSRLWSLRCFLQKILFLLHQYFSLFFNYILSMSKETIFIEIYRSNTLISKHSLVSDPQWMMIFEDFKYLNFRVLEHPQPRIFNIFGYLLSVVKLYSHLNGDSRLFASTT